MNFTFDENIVSDLHKDARGFRPTEYFWEEWHQCGDENRQAMWDSLLDELSYEMFSEAKRQLDAQRRFEKQVAVTIALGAGDRTTAIVWILDAEDFDASDAAYGGSSVCYHFGLWHRLAEQFEEACAMIIARNDNPYDTEVA